MPFPQETLDTRQLKAPKINAAIDIGQARAIRKNASTITLVPDPLKLCLVGQKCTIAISTETANPINK